MDTYREIPQETVEPGSMRAVSWRFSDVRTGLVVLLGLVLVVMGPLERVLPDLWTGPLMLVGTTALMLWMLLFPFRAARRAGTPISLRSEVPARPGIDILYTLLATVAIAVAFGVLFSLLQHLFGLDAQPQALRDDILQMLPEAVLIVVLIVLAIVIAPIIEEIFFRGFLYNALRRRWGVAPAAVVQAILFGLSHTYDPQHVFVAALLGLALVAFYEWRRSLVSVVLLHAVWNALSTLPLVLILMLNQHTPADSLSEASQVPRWLRTGAYTVLIERQSDAEAHRLWTIEHYGSKGAHIWKVALAGLLEVDRAFPEQPDQAALAWLGAAEIYGLRLRDHYRAAAIADIIGVKYPEESYASSRALALAGWAYLVGREHDRSQQAFRRLLAEYPEEGALLDFARRGLARLKWLAEQSPQTAAEGVSADRRLALQSGLFTHH